MNKKIFFSIIATGMLYLSACKKDTSPVSPSPAHANTPTCAYVNTRPASGGGYETFVTFLDLSKPANANKKYFDVVLKYQGVKDSFELGTPPQSINNMAGNFPEEITYSPGYGAPGQWTNSEYRLLSNGGGNFYKDTIVRNPQSNIYYLHQNFLSGSLKGAWPQSNLDWVSVPTGINGQNDRYSRIVFYFKKGLCLKPALVPTPEFISAFYKGAPNIYDWVNIDAVIQVQQSATVPGVTTYNFYFFDFKNWRYFIWKQYGNPVLGTVQLATTFEGYQSLDNFCKWPEGWGRS